MSRESAKRHFIDLIEGGLDAELEASLREQIEADEQLRREFEEYRQVVALEQDLASETPSIPAGLTDDVMRAVHSWEPAWQTRLAMFSKAFTRYFLIPGTAVAATAAIALVVSYKQAEVAKEDLSNILRESASDSAAEVSRGSGVAAGDRLESGAAEIFSKLIDRAQDVGQGSKAPPELSSVASAIPPGHRAVTIEVDSRSGVEGFTGAGSSVDTIVTYRDQATGERKSMVAVENAKVLSVGGAASGDTSAAGRSLGKTTVTIAVPQRDARKIAAARESGELSLTMGSSADEVRADRAARRSASSSDLLSVVPSSVAAGSAEGVREGYARFEGRDGTTRQMELRGNSKWYEAGKGAQAATPQANKQRFAKSVPQKPSAAPSAFGRRGETDTRFREATGLERESEVAEIAPGQRSEHARRYPEIAPYDYVVPSVSGERYGHYEENPRQTPVEAPFSTFGVDVDTASYTNMRRFLSAGRLPPNDAVRIEEFINYFDYDYPSTSEQPFTVSYEIAPSPLEPERFLMKVGVKASEVEQLGTENGWNLVFLIDTSGSMGAPNKLPLVKQSLKLLTANMRPQDRIAIVTYSGMARVALSSTSGEDKARILSVINSLRPAGGTNGGAGIDMAYAIAQQNMIDGGVNRVILATDGDFNVGNYHFGQLMSLIEHKRRSGVTLTTLGFGAGNINEKNMEQLANRGNGNYFYVDSFKEARRIFDEKLFSTIEVVAKDVKLQVEFNPLHVLEYRLIGYDNRRLQAADFANDAKDAGEIGSGHEVTAIYELVLTDTPLAKRLINQRRYGKSAKSDMQIPENVADELAYIKLRFKEPTANRSNLLTYTAKRSDVSSDASKASDDFRFAAAVSYFGHLLRASRYAGSYNMQQIAQLARGALGSDENGHRREFVELVENARFASKRF